jgi:hypothetical protein
MPGPSSCPYSPKCVEEEFSEVRFPFVTNVSKIRNLRDTLLYLMGVRYVRIMDR